MSVLADTLAWALRKRILRGKLRKLALRAISGVAYDICIEGVRLRCHLGDNNCEHGTFIRGLRVANDALGQVFYGLKPGDIFVDIGANAGIFTTMGAKQVGPRGRVIAIEPAPKMVDRLRANVAANGFTNVAVFEMAVGSTSGFQTLHLKPGSHGEYSLASGSMGGSSSEVQVAPLADIITAAGVDRIDYLKIDIEGFEDRALVPFIQQAPSALWPKQIFIEIARHSAWKEDCVATLLGVGYAEIWRSKTDILLALTGEVGRMIAPELPKVPPRSEAPEPHRH